MNVSKFCRVHGSRFWVHHLYICITAEEECGTPSQILTAICTALGKLTSNENGHQGCGIYPGSSNKFRSPGYLFKNLVCRVLCRSEMTSLADSESHVLFVSLSLAILPLAGVVFSIYLTYSKWLESPFRGLPYPLGPIPKNIISGNLSDIPRSQPWHTYAKWAKIYGKQCFNHIISSFIQWLLLKATSFIFESTASIRSSWTRWKMSSSCLKSVQAFILIVRRISWSICKFLCRM